MGRYSTGGLTTAGSTTLPIISLYGGAGTKQGRIVEVGITNTTTTGFAIKLVRLTTNGTLGTGLTEAFHDPQTASPNCQGFNTHSGNPSLGDDLGYRATIGAALGAGIVWTFGGGGITTGASPNGVGVIVENGTGQAAQAYMVWDE